MPQQVNRLSSTTHLVSAFDLHDFGAETVRIGDLNGDGAPDLLLTQSTFGQREITCLTAVTISGEMLWQVGTPSAARGSIYGDLPVQIYDWDHDGVNEVLYIRQAVYAEPVLYDDPPFYREHSICERARRYDGDATLVVLDGVTGRQKGTFPLPAPADGCFLFADLTGRGRREDLLVKDNYWNMWGVSHAGEVLWHWPGSTGHYPAIADVDGDGRDEVFVGYALLDHDGTELFRKDWDGWDGTEDPWGVPMHQDAAYIVRLADGSWRLLFGNGGIHCLAVDGAELWHHPLQEAQHVVAGRFRGDSEVQVAVIDRGYPRTPEGKPADLLLYDIDGRELWRRPQPAGGWCAACLDIRWSSDRDVDEILVYKRGVQAPIAIYDGRGDIVDEIDVPAAIRGVEDPADLGNYYCCRASVWGDGRDEVLVYGRHGMQIHANRRPLALPTLYNNTLYHGM